MLYVTKHVADDNFVFQQDSEPTDLTTNTVKLLQREILNLFFDFFLNYGSQHPRAETN